MVDASTFQHAKSDNPQDFPEIIPNYFKEEFGKLTRSYCLPASNSLPDTKVLVEHVKFVRSLTETEPFKSNCTEVQPGPACVSDEQIAGAPPQHGFHFAGRSYHRNRLPEGYPHDDIPYVLPI